MTDKELKELVLEIKNEVDYGFVDGGIHFSTKCERALYAIMQRAEEKRIFDIPYPGDRRVSQRRGEIEKWFRPGVYPDCLQPLEVEASEDRDILGDTLHGE